MSILCSILIPTRGRVRGLEEAIFSIVYGCKSSHVNNYEFLIRYDDDDDETDKFLRGFICPDLVRSIRGPRGNGWHDCHKYYTELCNIAQGDFIWVGNDDITVHGPWFDRLVEAPKRAFIQPENYGLNESLYKECPDVGFPIIPRNAWLEYDYVGKPLMPNPIDSQTYELLVRQHGWPVHFLSGVTVQHDRKADATLGKERL